MVYSAKKSFFWIYKVWCTHPTPCQSFVFGLGPRLILIKINFECDALKFCHILEHWIDLVGLDFMCEIVGNILGGVWLSKGIKIFHLILSRSLFFVDFQVCQMERCIHLKVCKSILYQIFGVWELFVKNFYLAYRI